MSQTLSFINLLMKKNLLMEVYAKILKMFISISTFFSTYEIYLSIVLFLFRWEYELMVPGVFW